MRILLGLWVVASVGWIIGVGYACVGAWPHLSLDLSPTDAGTLSAYDAAVTWHVLSYGAIALVVPAIVFVVGRVLMKGRR